MRRAALAAVALAAASCAAAPRSEPAGAGAAAARPEEPAPVVAGVAMLPIDWQLGHGQSLVFVGGGRHVVVATDNELALVDLAARRLAAPLRWLASERAKSPYPPPHDELRYRVLDDVVWAWDARRGELVGAGRLDEHPVVDRSQPPRPALVAWEPAAQPVPRALEGVAREVRAPFALSPVSGVMLAHASSGGAPSDAVQAFDLGSGRPLGARVTTGTVAAAAFSADGRFAALGIEDGSVRVLEPATGALTTLPRGHDHAVTSVAFHPTRPLLVTADVAEVRIWRFGPAGDPRTAAASAAVARGADLPAFSADGRYLAVRTARGVLLLGGDAFAPVAGPLRLPPGDHEDIAESIDALGFSPDARRLVIAGGDHLAIVELGPPPGGWPSTPAERAASAGPAASAAWFARIAAMPVPPPRPVPPIEPGGDVRGRVLADGRPVAGAEVRLVPHHNEWPDARALAPRTVRTGRDGRYHLADLPRIEWTVAVRAPRRLEHRAGAFLRGQRTLELEHDLRPAATLEVRVRRADGKPAAGARLHLVRYPGSGFEATAVAGRDGRAVFDHLPPAPRFVVWARDALGEAATAEIAIARAAPSRVGLRLSRPGAPGVVRLRVVSESGVPLPGAPLTFTGWIYQAATDPDGTYSFAVPPGPGHVRVQTVMLDGRAVGLVESYPPHATELTIRVPLAAAPSRP